MSEMERQFDLYVNPAVYAKINTTYGGVSVAQVQSLCLFLINKHDGDKDAAVNKLDAAKMIFANAIVMPHAEETAEVSKGGE